MCGQRIVVTFDSAKVKNVKVEDSDPPCGGVYIEPNADSSKKKTPPGRAAPPGSTPVPTPKPVTPAPATPGQKPAMTGPINSPRIQQLIDRLARGDRSTALALHAIILAADADGFATLDDVAVIYRRDHLAAQSAAGRDAEREAGELSMDQVRSHLATSVLPRLASEGSRRAAGRKRARAQRAAACHARALGRGERHPREEVADVLRHTGEYSTTRESRASAPTPVVVGSVLEARGLSKIYRKRRVVNDVALRLQQGEIVGLLGPNGAGKTTTFYMIVGLIQPLNGPHPAGRIRHHVHAHVPAVAEGDRLPLPGALHLPKALRRGQHRSHPGDAAALEGAALGSLETLLDELSIKHLRHSKAYQLSGGERRRLEITRALVTEPKFMMLDEPFAGVDPIAVHDIQTIVANLRTRGIGVLISDHNVEQTLDIVDRAYIMFDGQVKVSGTVRELVFDDTVADIYLGPTLTARLRARFEREMQGRRRMRPGLGQHTQLKQELKINPRLYQAMDLLYMPLLDLQQHLKQELLNNPFLDMVEPDEEDEEDGVEQQEEPNPETEAEKEEKGEIDWEEILLDGFDAGGRREEHEEREYYEPVTVDTRDLADHLRDQVSLLDLNGRQMYLADEFIGNINEDGYLACGLERRSSKA